LLSDQRVLRLLSEQGVAGAPDANGIVGIDLELFGAARPNDTELQKQHQQSQQSQERMTPQATLPSSPFISGSAGELMASPQHPS